MTSPLRDPVTGAMGTDAMSLPVVREFHERMATIIQAVQAGLWNGGVHELVGYATDYAPGQQRGVQTLVLKRRHRSSYVRLGWDTVMGDAPADVQAVQASIAGAITELS